MSDGPHRLLRASAGTGKTYQLVQAYAEAVAAGHRPSEVVCITFTRKAAAELRSRIRERLAEAGATPQRIAELARAPISNFHGLALQLRRSLGPLGGLSEGSRILGKGGGDRQLFLAACEEAWFRDAAPLAADVQAVARCFAVDTRLASDLWEALCRAREDGAAVEGAALLGHYDPAALQRRLHNEIIALRDALAAVVPSQSATGKKQLQAFLAAPVPSPEAPTEVWRAAWARARQPLSRRAAYKTVYTEQAKQLLQQGIDAPLAAARCGTLAPPLGRLIDAAWASYTVAKRRLRALDFTDLVAGLVQALEADAALHRAVRRRVAVVLVDEAQDTNRLQRRFVRLLTGWDGPAADAAPPAQLTVVGDRKQAIYTFRGADPEAFDRLAADVVERGGSEHTLEVSRRSTAALVAAINHLGGHVLGERYEPLAPLDDAAKGPAGPPVTYYALDDAAQPDLARQHTEAAALAAVISERIAAGAAAGDFAVLLANMKPAPVFAAALGAAGIPAVLAGGGGGLYAQPEVADCIALLAWLADGRDGWAAAVALRSPLVGLSDSALLALLGRGGGLLARLRRGAALDEVALEADDAASIARLGVVLPELVAASRRLGAAQLLEHADALLDIRPTYLALEGGEQRLANIERLVELARRFDVDARGSAARFAAEQLLEVHGGPNARGEPVAAVPAAARRAVTISTVHQAKGLEFPVVVLADLRRKGRNDTTVIRYGREAGMVFEPRYFDGINTSDRWQRAAEAQHQSADAERRRLFYVAITRAQRQLVCIGRAPGTKPRPAPTSFAAFIEPWLEGACAAGIAQRRPVPVLSPLGASTAATASELSAAPAVSLAALADGDGALPAAHTRVVLPVTQLEAYVQCRRRGFLVHDLRLPEPVSGSHAGRGRDEPLRDPPLDPLSRGRLAHQVLAGLDRLAAQPGVAAFIDAELAAAGFEATDPRVADVRKDVEALLTSELGRALAAVAPGQRRTELPFALDLPAGPYVAVLHGQIDLLYRDADGAPVVIDYKHGRATADGAQAYRVQLEAYATAVAELLGWEQPVRTSLVFLHDGPVRVDHVVSPSMRRAFAAQVAEVAAEIVRLRARTQSWPAVPVEQCRALGCGFLQRCHPTVDRTGAD